MSAKYYYSIEEQINNCFAFLGKNCKSAFEMDDAELCKAEDELKRIFCWVYHPDYIQFIPKHIASGTLIEQ